MTPALTPRQGQLLRAIGKALSLSRDRIVYTSGQDGEMPTLLVENVTTTAWSSLTFAGERHRFALRVGPADACSPTLDERAIELPRHIVAVERCAVARAADGWRLVADLLTIGDPSLTTY